MKGGLVLGGLGAWTLIDQAYPNSFTGRVRPITQVDSAGQTHHTMCKTLRIGHEI